SCRASRVSSSSGPLGSVCALVPIGSPAPPTAGGKGLSPAGLAAIIHRHFADAPHAAEGFSHETVPPHLVLPGSAAGPRPGRGPRGDGEVVALPGGGPGHGAGRRGAVPPRVDSRRPAGGGR